MLLTVMQALGELAVVYPVNGAFYQYMVRFIDPAWYVGWNFFWDDGALENLETGHN